MSHIEMMESRRLLSATLVGTTVEIEGTRRADVIEVRLNKAGSRLFTSVNGTEATFPLSKVRSVDIEAGNGDDRVNVSTSWTRPTDIDGDAGNDTIFGGSGADDIDGGSGNDYISGGLGRDSIEGGAGRDRLIGGADRDVFDDEDSASEIVDFNSRQDRIED